MITEDQIQELKLFGYHIEQREYYNPGGGLWGDAVIYPDHEFELYAEDVTRKQGAYLTLAEQWEKAWEHFQKDKPE